MKKNLEDIIPIEKRSIRDIPIPRKKEAVSDAHPKRPHNYAKDPKPEEPEYIQFKEVNYTGRGKAIWFFAAAAVVALILSLTWLFAKTTVSITMKKINIEAVGSFTAVQEAVDETTFIYDTVEITEELSKTVAATGQKEVSSKAQGTVVIYNNFSTAPQALVSGTRLETPEGLIYKINSGVTVPGRKTVSGKTVPGSVEVKVTAESAGDKYNVNLSDFTIPGFKGTAKFNAFYARSKTPMTGGMIGTVAEVSDQVYEETNKALDAELITAATSRLKAELPKEFVFINGGYEAVFDSAQPESQGSNAIIKRSITLKGYIFNQANLISSLAEEEKTVVIKDAPVDLEMDKITIESVEEEDGRAIFKFNGSLVGKYVLNEPALKEALRNQKKKDVPKILTNFPTIEKAQVVISPFWVSTLPGSSDKIFIEIDGGLVPAAVDSN